MRPSLALFVVVSHSSAMHVMFLFLSIICVAFFFVRNVMFMVLLLYTDNILVVNAAVLSRS